MSLNTEGRPIEFVVVNQWVEQDLIDQVHYLVEKIRPGNLVINKAGP